MRVVNYFFIGAICFFVGGAFMYQVDSTWLRDKLEAKEVKLNERVVRYSDALDVSQEMVNNCYDAFYTVSECSKKDGCDFKSTVDSLTELNVERKILRQKLDRLLDSLPTPMPPNFSPSKT